MAKPGPLTSTKALFGVVMVREQPVGGLRVRGRSIPLAWDLLRQCRQNGQHQEHHSPEPEWLRSHHQREDHADPLRHGGSGITPRRRPVGQASVSRRPTLLRTAILAGDLRSWSFRRPAHPPVESTMPARVLIVDDEPDVLNVLRESLLLEGHTVETTTTGAAAIAAVRERSPDVVLLDLNLPGVLDGRAVLGVISREVPVIVITAVNDLADARAQLQGGAFDFISKPFDFDRVNELVAAAIAYRGAP